jgi:putative hydroxymethylpyrimidine transport system substrate-binding protein
MGRGVWHIRVQGDGRSSRCGRGPTQNKLSEYMSGKVNQMSPYEQNFETDRWQEPRSRRFSVLFTGLLSLVVLALGACSSDTSVSLALDWFPNSNHAGIYAALDQGYFADEGLDVNVYTPVDPASVLLSVGAGRDDFGISYQTDLLQARNEGVPVVSITGIVQHPLNSVMALKSSGITRPADLRGLKVGYPGIPSNEGLLATMLASDGLTLNDVELIDIGFALTQSLAAGSVDAIVGAYWTHESIVLDLEGLSVNVMRMEDWGVPDFYELVLVASEKTVDERSDVARRLVRALSRGFEYALANPQKTIDIMVDNVGETMLEDVERKGVELLLPMWDDGVAPQFGWQESARWESFADWMKSEGLIDSSLDSAAAFTNRFVEDSGG